MATRKLRIVVLSDDRQHLRCCHDFFVACGYAVRTARRPDTTIRPAPWGDVVIYDATACGGWDPEEPSFKIAVVDPHDDQGVEHALSDGADDIVLGPATPARLLVRVRAAAQLLEARRRLDRKFRRVFGASYPGEGAFLGSLQHQIEQLQQPGFVSAVIFSVPGDSLACYRLWLEDLVGSVLPDAQVFELPDQRVAMICPRTSPQKVIEWAQQHLGTAGELHDTTVGDTKKKEVSAGFAYTRDASINANELSLVLGDRLNLAMSLGGGILIDDNQERQWLPPLSAVSIFDGMTAEDMMRPITLRLEEDESVSSALEQLRHWNLEVAPVFALDGNFRGLVTLDSLESHVKERHPVVRYCQSQVALVNHDAAFDELVSLLSAHDAPWLQVTRADHPVGIIHCDDLTSMNSPMLIEAV